MLFIGPKSLLGKAKQYRSISKGLYKLKVFPFPSRMDVPAEKKYGRIIATVSKTFSRYYATSFVYKLPASIYLCIDFINDIINLTFC
jgi:hypothetical protein